MAIRSLFSKFSHKRSKLAILSADDTATIYAELERILLQADTGTKAANAIIAGVRKQVGHKFELSAFGAAVRKVTCTMLAKLERPAPVWQAKPHVVMMVGTNGGGKTTTTAKLAHMAVAAGKTVVLAAADTFRAAAGEQLQELADRLGAKVQVVADNDPGAAAYNAVTIGLQRQVDLVVIDTAGRQPTSSRLMEEAKKIKRAISKAILGAPHETLLALDANTGQNGLRQVESFYTTIGLTGLVLTKLDSTARGGCIFGISSQYDLPIRFIGLGEGVNDCQPFSATTFSQELFATTD